MAGKRTAEAMVFVAVVWCDEVRRSFRSLLALLGSFRKRQGLWKWRFRVWFSDCLYDGILNNLNRMTLFIHWNNSIFRFFT